MLHVVEHAAGHHLLGEGDDVGLDAEVLVAPHLPSGSTPCLHLSDQEDEDDKDDDDSDDQEDEEDDVDDGNDEEPRPS